MKDDKVACPCCNKIRSLAMDTPLLFVEDELRQHNASPWWGDFEGWSIQKAKSKELQWACYLCLKSGLALAAQTWMQKFCDYCPHFAYFDVSLHCEDCQKTFIFSAKEQQYWYEVLKFWVQSRPKHCVECRRTRRK